jgi:hypothetical protein
LPIISKSKALTSQAWAALRREQVPSIDMGDLQLIAGLGALTYGVSLVSVPAAWITLGGFLLVGWILPRLPRAKRGN